MRIGINLLFMIPGIVGGTETYAVSLVNALAKIDPDNEYFLFINKETKPGLFDAGRNFQFVACPIRATNRAARFLWEQLVLPSQTRGYSLDLLHSPGYIAPLSMSMKSVVTIPDLNYRAIPEAFNGFTRTAQKFFVENSARRVDRLITISEFTRGDIINRLEIPGDKITAILLAPKEQTNRQQISWDELILKHRINRPYVFVLSSKSPHKNIPRMVEGFLRANHALGHTYQLIVGGHLPDHSRAADQIAAVVDESSDIRATGYVSDAELGELMAHASAFAFPSLYEGFGLPALEAMAAGVPVVSSNRASLPEVCGDAALYFDPVDVDAISVSLQRVLTDAELRSQLVERGTENLKRFSWETTARHTLEVYKSLV